MMGAQTSRSNLLSDLQTIYQGDTNYSPEACNAVHAYQDVDQGGGGADKLVLARTQYRELVQKAAQASSNRMKCLVADFTQRKDTQWFYDPAPPPAPSPPNDLVPNLNRVADFVNFFIDDINGLNLANNVLGWYLADEPHETSGSSTKPSLQHFTDICQRAHSTQQSRGWNKPFYVVFYMDASWATDNNNINFCQWIDPWVNAVTTTVGANIVIMIDYYPWFSTAEDFRFSQSPASEASRSPLRRWWKFIHDTNARYSSNSRVVGVQAVVQALGDTCYSFRIPSHADMHQQIRAVRNFMSETGSKPAGVWLYGWGRGASVNTPANNVMACKRWTQSGTERWAEAVQNEIDYQTEGISAAIPADNTVVQAIPISFPVYNRSTKLGGCWFTFRLKDRGRVEFTIKPSGGGSEVRRLSWDYSYNSVQQKAVNTVSPSPGQSDKLGAVAIFFDGKHNNGSNLGGSYTCQMLLNGNPVGSTINITVQS